MKMQIKVDDKNINLVVQKPKSIDNMKKELFELIENINNKKDKMNLNYLKQRLEKAKDLCQSIIREEEWKKFPKILE